MWGITIRAKEMRAWFLSSSIPLKSNSETVQILKDIDGLSWDLNWVKDTSLINYPNMGTTGKKCWIAWRGKEKWILHTTLDGTEDEYWLIRKYLTDGQQGPWIPNYTIGIYPPDFYIAINRQFLS